MGRALAYLVAVLAALVALAIAAFGAAIVVVMLTEETGPNEGPLRIGLSLVVVAVTGGPAFLVALLARGAWRRARRS